MLRRFSLFLLTLMSAAHVGQAQAAVSPTVPDNDGVRADDSVVSKTDQISEKPRNPPAILGVRG